MFAYGQSQASISAFEQRFCTALHRPSVRLCALLLLPPSLLCKVAVLLTVPFLELPQIIVFCSAWKDASPVKYLLWKLFWQTLFSLFCKGSLMFCLFHSKGLLAGLSCLVIGALLRSYRGWFLSILNTSWLKEQAFFKVIDFFCKLHCVNVTSTRDATSQYSGAHSLCPPNPAYPSCSWDSVSKVLPVSLV